MPTGDKPASLNHLIMSKEATAGTYDSGAPKILGIDFTGDGNAFANIQRFIEHMPEGFNSIVGAVLADDTGTVTGRFMPHYATFLYRMRQLAGTSAVTSAVMDDARIHWTMQYPELDVPNIDTFTGHYGSGSDAFRLLYGKLQAMSIECSRGGEVGGTLTQHFNRVTRNQSQLTSPVLGEGPYVEPTHVLCYKATDAADLADIDNGWDDEHVFDAADDHIITTAQGNTFSMEDLVNPSFYEDRKAYPASHVVGARNVTASITLPKDTAGRCEEIYATETGAEGGCGVLPWWFRQHYKCGDYELAIDLYCMRNAQPDNPTDNNIMQRTFPLRRVYNPTGSLFFHLILPAP